MAKEYVAFLINPRKLYHGAWCDCGNEKLAPGIWAVALSMPVPTDTEPMYHKYALTAESVDEVFEILNIRHPADYRNRSLSVGDVVVDVAARKAYLCCSVGWKEMPECIPLNAGFFGDSR